jgi:hypothetical protein
MTKRVVRVQVDRGTQVAEFDVEGLAEAQKIVVALSHTEAFGVFALAKALAELDAAGVEPNWTDLGAPRMCSCGWTGDDEHETEKIPAVQDDSDDDDPLQELPVTDDAFSQAMENADTIRMERQCTCSMGYCDLCDPRTRRVGERGPELVHKYGDGNEEDRA